MLGRKPTEITIIAPTRTEYVTRHVTEQRAPTDDSVKLLREMEKAARDQIISAVVVDANEFKCVLHFAADFASARLKILAIYDLNGRRHEIEISVTERSTKQEAVMQIRDAIAKSIASEGVSSALQSADVEFQKATSTFLTRGG